MRGANLLTARTAHGPAARQNSRGSGAACFAATLLISISAGNGARAQQQQAPGNFIESRPFSIPDKQSARALYDQALAHVNGGRFSEAVASIDQLIDEHSTSVIALPLGAETPLKSSQQVYRGAADAARELLASLPPAARAACADRYEAKANALLLRAVASHDTTALADVARRYPLSHSARDAWWTLGDIEAEAGNLDAARAAWKRAGSASLAKTAPAALALRGSWNPGDGAVGASRSASFTLARAALEALEVPAGDAHHWDSPLSLDEPGPFTSQREYFNSFPIVSGDCVLFSNSLTLTCVDGLTGRIRWRSAEHPGWADVRAEHFVARDASPVSFSGFFEGFDREGLMLAPASACGIAVAALQVPFTPNGNTSFQNQIRITTVLADRRLYAFDQETGAPLWNHAPPPLWDCDSGDFTQIMRVAGPPVIAGTRVLVPMWRPQGRISYYVAAFELAGGALLWSTQVASGQRPLNMFGRPQLEFCAPPLVVVGEKVIALTQLGTLAALDLFSGELLWQTIYNQLPLLPADGMSASPRNALWRNAPPAVEDGMIVATPLDSPDMLGIDLETGAVRWELEASAIGRSKNRSGGPWCLIGVRDDTVYLGGRSVLALYAPEKLSGAKGPTVETGNQGLFGDGYANAYQLPRPILTAQHVIVPTREGRIALERLNLKNEDPRFSGSWGEGSLAGFGNLALANGAMFSLSGRELCGVLDWHSMELRIEQDFAQHPDDGALATRLGDFLRERAAGELANSKLPAALEHLKRAEKVLNAPAQSGLKEARSALFSSLRLEARAMVLNSESAKLSLERLERAVGFAPDRERLALVLAEIARATRGRAPQRFESSLLELERQCDDLDFPNEAGAPSELTGSVRRWVIEQRIANAATQNDLSSEFAALLDLLLRCDDGVMTNCEVAEETPALRIDRRLGTGPRARAAWQPFEDRARAALDAAKSSGDGAALERVTRLFPHTTAARDARDARLRLAIDAKDSKTAVRTAFEELPAEWSPKNSTPRQAQLAWLAARALKNDGNPRFARSLLERLAQHQPRSAADERDPATTFAGLAAAQAAADEATAAAEERAGFDAPWKEVLGQSGESVLLGKLDLGDRSVFILAARDRFDAISADGKRLWTRPVEGAIAPTAWLSNALLVPGEAASGANGPAFSGRVVLTWRHGVQALDAASGEELWSWSLSGRLLDSPLAHDGGVLTVAALPDGSPAVLFGIDLGRGTELWHHECTPENWVQPVVGSGLVVLLPKVAPNRTAKVFEIATGTGLAELDIGQPAPIEDRRAAWIEAGRLVLPRFGRARGPEQDALVSFDLDSGARAWRVPSEGARNLDSIVRCGQDTYLVYLVNGTSGHGGVVELDTRIGAVREVPGVSIGPDDLPIGLRSNAVTRLDAPYLFLRSPAPGGKETLVRAIHLPYGQRWAYRLQISQADLYVQSLPLPAISSKLVVLVYTEAQRSNSPRSQSITRLVPIDRESGGPSGNSINLQEMGPSDAVELATFGNLLFVRGKNRTMVLAGSNTEEQR